MVRAARLSAPRGADEGDRSRGARYNSAVKYLASAEDTPTVILLVTADGMINLLPTSGPGCAERI